MAECLCGVCPSYCLFYALVADQLGERGLQFSNQLSQTDEKQYAEFWIFSLWYGRERNRREAWMGKAVLKSTWNMFMIASWFIVGLDVLIPHILIKAHNWLHLHKSGADILKGEGINKAHIWSHHFYGRVLNFCFCACCIVVCRLNITNCSLVWYIQLDQSLWHPKFPPTWVRWISFKLVGKVPVSFKEQTRFCLSAYSRQKELRGLFLVSQPCRNTAWESRVELFEL